MLTSIEVSGLNRLRVCLSADGPARACSPASGAVAEEKLVGTATGTEEEVEVAIYPRKDGAWA